MKILCIDTVQKFKNLKQAFNNPLGGLTAKLLTLIEGFTELGHQTVILTNTDSVDVQSWNIHDSINNIDDYLPSCDVILINAYMNTSLLMKIKNKPIFFVTGDLTLVDRTWWLYNDNFKSLITGFIFVSEYHSKIMCETYKIPENKVSIITNPINKIFHVSKENIDGIRFKKSLSGGAPCKIFPDISDVINNVNHTDIIFNIISTNDLYSNYNDIPCRVDKSFTKNIRELNKMNINILNPVGKKELYEYYYQHLTYVHPNCYPETCCAMILEAMTCGCIPIVINEGPFKEYITNGVNGFLINRCDDPLDTCKLLSDVIVDVHSMNKDQLNKVSNNAKQIYDIFNYYKTATKYIEFFRNI
jgi:glycosyltransferase involved in cell wall biosynthesis